MIAFASLLGLMMAGTVVDFGDAVDRAPDDDDDMPDADGNGYAAEMPRFSFEDLLSGAMTTEAFADPEYELESYLEDEAALDAVPEGALTSEDAPDWSSLDEWLALTGDGPTVIDEFDEAEDALFVVYDATAHPAPVLTVEASDTGDEDAMLMLDGMPLAVVGGGAGLDPDAVRLVPEGQLPEALAAGV
ncbi:hypothetical protein SAMN05444722_2473 [Rhodovulum sp. ES.010]|uniref:hypothetical protein n=1 Tax=Rhodovulum sp. ES.010 TaxID=1882821 RepID=UPI000926BBE7|nr:hypothetical protein [Rhodovulum sp. ES.010]SIO47917.1 hypothetical protein SAMN05444722_2473 [Rhodovulum sp. ES.010]